MAPVPTTTQTLTTRLTALSESNKALGQLIQRLAKLDFQPGSQPLGTDEGDVRLELSAEIHETLKGIEEDLELVRQEVEDVVGGANSSARRRDSKNESERSRLAVLLARLTEDLKSYVDLESLEYLMMRCANNLTSTGLDHSSAKHNSLLNTTPTAQSSKNVSSSSRIYNPAPRLRPLPIVKGSRRKGYQKVKWLRRPRQTSLLHCDGHTN
jgi:hypothetical protein